MDMIVNRCSKCGSSNVEVVQRIWTGKEKYHVWCCNCGKLSRQTDTRNEAIADWNGILKETYSESIAPSWIYEDNERFFEYSQLLDDVEKAFGFKLFVWQKTYICFGTWRRSGKTLAIILRALLRPGRQYIDFIDKPSTAEEMCYRKQLMEVKRRLDAAGIETNPVFTSINDLRTWRKRGEANGGRAEDHETL